MLFYITLAIFCVLLAAALVWVMRWWRDMPRRTWRAERERALPTDRAARKHANHHGEVQREGPWGWWVSEGALSSRFEERQAAKESSDVVEKPSRAQSPPAKPWGW